MALKPELPGRDGYIWRYMDFTKYMSMLESSSLYFTRLDKLGDPYESTYPRGNVKAIQDLPDVWYEEAGGSKEADVEYSKALAESFVKFASANCWHANQHESAAMWKLYLKSDEGIAIRSSIGRIDNALGHLIKPTQHWGNITQPINYDMMTYMDYETERMDESQPTNYALHKRISFSHENEFRLLYIRDSPIEANPELVGHDVPVDLLKLIDHIFIAPTAQTWFFEIVKKITQERYKLNIEVSQSSLSSAPLK